MATVNFLREFVDTWPPDALVDGIITSRSANEMRYVSDLGYSIIWYGTNLTYDAQGFGAGGTVTRVVVAKDGQTYADFQGLDAAMQRMSMFAFGFEREPYKSPISSDAEYLYEHMMRGNDVITGTFRDDEINGGLGNDLIQAKGGDDFVDSDAGNDTIDGGAGWDILSFENANWDFAPTHGINLNLASGTLTDAWGGQDSVTGFESIRDSLFNDRLVGSAEGEDFYITRGNDTVDGGGGADAVLFTRSDNWGATKGVVVNLTTGIVKDSWGGTDRLQNIHGIVDSIFNDTLRGSDSSDAFFGFDGKDVYDGRGGSDVLSFDNVDWLDEGHGVIVNLAFTGGEVRDDGFGNIENIANIEIIAGSDYGDKLIGAGGADDLNGLWGRDTVQGGSNDDSLSGGYGHDILRGGTGVDILSGDQGNDTLTGGAGADTFRFTERFASNGVDTITDFVSGTDSLVLWQDWIPGHSEFHLGFDQFRSGAGVTTAGTADHRVIYNTTTGDLYFDVDGTGSAAAVKFAVLAGAPTLSFLDIWTTAA